MPTLTSREISGLRGKIRGPEIDRIVAHVPVAMLVTDRMTPAAMIGPCFPVPKGSRGWKLWKASRLELVDYLCAFERRSLETDDPAVARARATEISEEAEALCLPILFDNVNTAVAFDHDRGPGDWDFFGVYGNRRLYQIGAANTSTFKDVLRFSRYPVFDKVDPLRVLACGVRAEAHRQHPRCPFLRVLCKDDHNTRTVLPWLV